MSRLTSQAQGRMAELLFVTLAVLGSRGVIKAGMPMVDDEGRDVEIHIGGRFRAALAIQVKSSAARLRWYGTLLRLQIPLHIRPESLVDDPRYWYFLAHIDLRLLRLSEYVFLVPSKTMHAFLRASLRRGERSITFQTNMDPAAHDRWTPYRLKSAELGQRLVDLMHEAPQGFIEAETLSALRTIPGLCMLGTESASNEM